MPSLRFRQINQRKNQLMEKKWRFSRKNLLWVAQNDESQDPTSTIYPIDREISAKNALFNLAESQLDNSHEVTPHLNQWFKAQSKSITKESPAPPRTPKARMTVHARPFFDRSVHSNLKIEESIIPRLKQQLLKLESHIMPPQTHAQKRKSEFVQPKMRRKYELLSFEEMLHNYRHSVRVKNTPLPRKSAKLTYSQNSEEMKGRKLLTRGSSSKELRQSTSQILMRQQARKSRTLNNLLQ